jgi:hypothetical protein
MLNFSNFYGFVGWGDSIGHLLDLVGMARPLDASIICFFLTSPFPSSLSTAFMVFSLFFCLFYKKDGMIVF